MLGRATLRPVGAVAPAPRRFAPLQHATGSLPRDALRHSHSHMLLLRDWGRACSRPDMSRRSAVDDAAATEPAPAVVTAPAEPAKAPPLTIGLVGFGNFGQFLADRFIRNGQKVIAWNRKEEFDYPALAKQMGVTFYQDMDEFCEAHPDVVILVTSILSTKSVLEQLPLMRLKMSTLIVDVLSVKVFPKQLLLSRLPKHFDILCTHPMFGKNSGSGSWAGLNFQYEKVRIIDEPERLKRVERFLDIFDREGCRMVEMSCEDHDEAAASTQFVTHTVGRMLGTMRLQSSPINTKGFEALLTLTDQTNTDSFDLYYGLFLYNQNATDELERIEKGLESVKDRLFSRLHDIARREMFPQAMIEKMLSKDSATVLKLFFRGLARYNSLTFASTASIEAESDAMYEDHPDVLMPMYEACLTIWRDKALEAGGKPPKPPSIDGSLTLDDDGLCVLPEKAAKGLGLMREAFAFVDIDDSGGLSPGELTARVLKLSNTRMTNAEITKMIELADFDGDGVIGFRELLLFCAFEFFTCGAQLQGDVDSRSVRGAINYLELPADFASEAEVDMMLSYASGGEDSALHSIKAFALVYQGITKLVAEGHGDMAPAY